MRKAFVFHVDPLIYISTNKNCEQKEFYTIEIIISFLLIPLFLKIAITLLNICLDIE